MDDTRIAQEVLAYLAGEGIELSEDLTQVEQGVPFFHDIPVLSSLFSSTKDYTEDDEGIILVTPHIVRSD